MKKSLNTIEKDCLKQTYYDFINENKSSFFKYPPDGYRTRYVSNGGSFLISINDCHPTQNGLGRHQQIIKPNHKVKIVLNEITSSFLGVKKTKKVEFKIQDEIIGEFKIDKRDIEIFKKLKQLKGEFENNFKNEREEYEKEKEIKKEQLRVESQKKKEIEKKRLQKLKKTKQDFLSKFDKDKNGKVDITENNDFQKLISKHQNKIIEIDKKYVHNFIKISNYLRKKENNIQSIFDLLNSVKSIPELKKIEGLFKNQIHYYNIILFHSFNMVNSLVNNDLIVFYEIYEKFDVLEIFESNWERNTYKKINDIELNTKTLINKIEDLMFEINTLENNLIQSIEDLRYTTSESFNNLSSIMKNELKSINSSIDTNNLLTTIQTYQMYKVNKNTKRLN